MKILYREKEELGLGYKEKKSGYVGKEGEEELGFLRKKSIRVGWLLRKKNWEPEEREESVKIL
jgi:hypothetical protein